ncbi:MAG TPA: 2-amino-4-hydroxy-6-hydroxymethyldihydropteridine diphosphokinase [Sedimentisphaerales bacterium]|nr:2-amino-4-hydroxy-6-hydroxymethyldihydropteridine diphosphokinase [Sedimentisphaerales bacterium]HRS11019.1 2-amino-4-hydroxy-6-hydroxymethyldihydropteridine diphosphokinase [Sedimentisphaerales bacterium]HRV49265.1 2-amino-4-hydroxy-6-hydroxymethyldihydropteridine diphosphokinase [Sedimentisphaerales bacterium]
MAFISVGSNIEPERNIVAALGLLRDRTRVAGSSTFYRTAPVGRPDQMPFINGVWRIDTVLSPVLVRDELLRPIEGKLGRRRCADKFAPRTIDLDLVLYNDHVRKDEAVCLPHPDLVRPFVCVPVYELLDGADDIEPGLRCRMQKLLPDRPNVRPGEPLNKLTNRLRHMLF